MGGGGEARVRLDVLAVPAVALEEAQFVRCDSLGTPAAFMMMPCFFVLVRNACTPLFNVLWLSKLTHYFFFRRLLENFSKPKFEAFPLKLTY